MPPSTATSSVVFEADLYRIMEGVDTLLAIPIQQVPPITDGEEDLGENAMEGYIAYTTPLHEEYLEILKELKQLDKDWRAYFTSRSTPKERGDEEGYYDRKCDELGLPTKFPKLKNQLREIGQRITDAKRRKANAASYYEGQLEGPYHRLQHQLVSA